MTRDDRYDYELPSRLIAQEPPRQRSDGRLLLVDRARQTLAHHAIRDFPSFLERGDALVINDSRVLPAQLVGRRAKTGGAWEGLYLETEAPGVWRLLCKTRGQLRSGDEIILVALDGSDDLRLALLNKEDDGAWHAALVSPDGEPPDTLQVLERAGRVPLPHYIRGGRMTEADRRRYQTVYAREPGSVAAPTAGLHLTHELLSEIVDRGVSIVRVTLHVGPGTFRPITAEQIDQHQMHAEWFRLEPAAAEQLLEARRGGGRIVAVGTTSVRSLESAARDGQLAAFEGPTDLFIRPGHRFQAVDALLTNFHLPRSTLLVLVRALGGDELIRRAYAEAIAREYRFYSYGDAMLIV